MDRKILLVEDNERNMRLIKMLLQNRGYRIIEAADGISALNKALQERPDLIIMDIQLPGISGLDITKKLRRCAGFENIPIIALTAHAMKGEPQKFLRNGFTDYISKPINTREFPLQIEKFFGRGKNNGKDTQT